MNKKTLHIALLMSLVIGVNTPAKADGIVGSGFGNSKLTQVTPVKKKAGECVSFEATFSEPLNHKPSAVLDIERFFTNLLDAAILEVTKVTGDSTGKKYRMALTATTSEGCPKIENESLVTVSTVDETQSIPQSVTFKANKNSTLQKVKE